MATYKLDVYYDQQSTSQNQDILLAGKSESKQFCSMAWRDSFCLFFFLLSLAECTSRLGKVWEVNLGGVLIYTWPILTAGISVIVALMLSLILIFEHIAAYNQHEEHKFLIILILMVPLYALESVRQPILCYLKYILSLLENVNNVKSMRN